LLQKFIYVFLVVDIAEPKRQFDHLVLRTVGSQNKETKGQFQYAQKRI